MPRSSGGSISRGRTYTAFTTRIPENPSPSNRYTIFKELPFDILKQADFGYSLPGYLALRRSSSRTGKSRSTSSVRSIRTVQQLAAHQEKGLCREALRTSGPHTRTHRASTYIQPNQRLGTQDGRNDSLPSAAMTLTAQAIELQRQGELVRGSAEV